MALMEITNNLRKQLFLGNNEFRKGTLTVPAGATIKAGEILSVTSGKYVRSAGATSENYFAVYCGDDVTNSTESPVDVVTEVCIAGRVNSELLTISGTKATEFQADLLRGWSIVPLKVNEYSKLDNQPS